MSKKQDNEDEKFLEELQLAVDQVESLVAEGRRRGLQINQRSISQFTIYRPTPSGRKAKLVGDTE